MAYLYEKTDKQVLNVYGGSSLADNTKPIRVISITSGKGGVGKSSVVVNLAITLAKRGRRILILDADMGMANIDIMLGLPTVRDLTTVFKGEKRLADIMLNGPYGIKIIPGGSGIEGLATLNSTEKLVMMTELDEVANNYDYLLIDTSTGLNSNVTFFNAASSEIIVIINPEPTSITDGYALIKVLSQNYNVKKFSILLNSVLSEAEALRVYKKLASVADRFLQVSMNYIGYLPYEKMISETIKEQNPLANKKVVSQYLKEIENLAMKLELNQPEDVINGNMQFCFRNLIERA